MNPGNTGDRANPSIASRAPSAPRRTARKERWPQLKKRLKRSCAFSIATVVLAGWIAWAVDDWVGHSAARPVLADFFAATHVSVCGQGSEEADTSELGEGVSVAFRVGPLDDTPSILFSDEDEPRQCPPDYDYPVGWELRREGDVLVVMREFSLFGQTAYIFEFDLRRREWDEGTFLKEAWYEDLPQYGALLESRAKAGD